MMIPISNIAAFMQCPRYYHFLQSSESSPLPFKQTVVESVIKKAYLQAMETGFKMTWKKVLGLVDTAVFADIDVGNEEAFQSAKLLSEYVLRSIQKWYTTVYLDSNLETFVDIPLKSVVNKHTICGIVPVIQVGPDIPLITVVTNPGLTVTKLYNDFTVRGLAWLVQNELEADSLRCIGLGIGPKGSVDTVSAFIDKAAHSRTSRVLYEIVTAIGNGVDYPSVTEKCNSCLFSGRCKL